MYIYISIILCKICVDYVPITHLLCITGINLQYKCRSGLQVVLHACVPWPWMLKYIMKVSARI